MVLAYFMTIIMLLFVLTDRKIFPTIILRYLIVVSPYPRDRHDLNKLEYVLLVPDDACKLKTLIMALLYVL